MPPSRFSRRSRLANPLFRTLLLPRSGSDTYVG